MALGLERLGYTIPSRRSALLAVTHANVLTMDGRQPLADHTVVVRGDRIVRVAPSSSMPTEGMDRIDGSGRYLLPGLADMHVHFVDPAEFALYLTNGVTAVRNMSGTPQHLAWQDGIAAGALPGPRMYTTGPILDGVGRDGRPYWARSSVVLTEGEARTQVEEAARRGYQQIKTYQWLTLEVLQAIGAAAAHAGLRVVGHCPEGVSFEDAADAGMSCFEHLTGVVNGRLVGGQRMPRLLDHATRRGSVEALRLFKRLDLDAVRRMAARFAAESIWTCPTLVVWQQGAELEELTDEILGYESPATVVRWQAGSHLRIPHPRCSAEEWRDLLRARFELLAEVVGILHREGAPLLLGTDTPNPFVPHGFSIHQELANLTRSGMSTLAALRAGTVEAARFLGESDWGRVAPGQRADLLLVDGNPLDDLTVLRRPSAVLVNGYRFDRSELDRLCEQRKASLVLAVQPDKAPARRGKGGANGETLLETVDGRGQGVATVERQREGPLQRLVESYESVSLRRWSTVLLDGDGRLRSAEVRSEHVLGDESFTIERLPDTGYRVTTTAVDGVTSDRTLDCEHAIAGPRLSLGAIVVAVDEWRAGRLGGPLAVLDIGFTELTEGVVDLDAPEAADVDGRDASPTDGEGTVRAVLTLWRGPRRECLVAPSSSSGVRAVEIAEHGR